MPPKGSIKSESVKDKLRNLKKLLPAEMDVVYDMAKGISNSLKPEITPQDFYNAAVFYLAQRYGSGNMSSDCFRRAIPNIAEATCPFDFADEVRALQERYVRGG
jgi:hypothetical protein